MKLVEKKGKEESNCTRNLSNARNIISTVEPPINGHPKRRTPLNSGQNIFPRPFSGQILKKYVFI